MHKHAHCTHMKIRGLLQGMGFLFHSMALGIEHQALGQVLLPSEHLIYLNLDFKNCLTIIAWVGGEEKARKIYPSVK